MGTRSGWDKRLIDQAFHVPSIIFCFIVFYRLGALKNLYFYFQRIKKHKLKQFLKSSLQQIVKKEIHNTWNIRCLVDESFVPASSQGSSVSYRRFTDFKTTAKRWLRRIPTIPLYSAGPECFALPPLAAGSAG